MSNKQGVKTHTRIYVLRCAKKKYFVGKYKSNDAIFDKNIRNYKSVCAWTERYSPVSVQEIMTASVDDTVISYMKKHGIENVRGGSWQQMELTDAQICCIKKMINPMPKPVESKRNEEIKLDWPCDICNMGFNTFEEAEEHEGTCSSNKSSSLTCEKINDSTEDSISITEYLSDFVSHSMGTVSYIASFIRD